MIKPAIGNRLREQRRRRGLSSTALGRIAGTSAQTVCRLETNIMPMTLAWVQRFANALECDPADILPASFLLQDTGLEDLAALQAELRKRDAKIAALEKRLNLIRDVADIWG